MAKSVYWKNHDKVEKAFRNTVEFKRLAYVGLGAFEHLQTGGMQDRVEENQDEWRPLNKYYLHNKMDGMYHREIYMRTGKLAKMLNHMPKRVGKSQGVNYRISKTYVARIEYEMKVKGRKAKRTFGRLNHMRPLVFWDNADGGDMLPHIQKRIDYIFTQEGLGALNTFKAGR